MLPKCIANGKKNGFCYAYILGKCQQKMCVKSPKGHAPAGDITDAFAWQLCNGLALGVEKRLAMEHPTSYSSKWYNRTA